MRARFVRAVTPLFALLFLGACAFTEDVVDLSYAPEAPAQSIGVDGKQFSVNVEDVRGEYLGTIGAKVNGFGVETADIKSSVPVSDILKSAFAEELASRKLVIDEAANLKLNVAITAMHNNFQVGAFTGSARGITAFTVKLSDANGAIVYEGAVSEVHVEEGIMLATGDNAAIAVEGSMRNAMKALFTDQAFIDALVGA